MSARRSKRRKSGSPTRSAFLGVELIVCFLSQSGQRQEKGPSIILHIFRILSSRRYHQLHSQDFPNNYEILLNTQHLRVTKGLKGKANSTAPVDLMQANAMKWSAGIYNLINFTHTGPTLNKKTKLAKVCLWLHLRRRFSARGAAVELTIRCLQKFYFQVCLTEMTNSDAMKQEIMARKKTAAEVVQQSESQSASHAMQWF